MARTAPIFNGDLRAVGGTFGAAFLKEFLAADDTRGLGELVVDSPLGDNESGENRDKPDASYKKKEAEKERLAESGKCTRPGAPVPSLLLIDAEAATQSAFSTKVSLRKRRGQRGIIFLIMKKTCCCAEWNGWPARCARREIKMSTGPWLTRRLAGCHLGWRDLR